MQLYRLTGFVLALLMALAAPAGARFWQTYRAIEQAAPVRVVRPVAADPPAPSRAGQSILNDEQAFTVTDILALRGCAMAHCDRQMSGNARLLPPLAPSTSALWHDTSRLGSDKGLGCASNGSVAACSFATNSVDQLPTLTVYDATGQQRWSSSLLNGFAFASAPIVDAAGGVIAADTQRVVRYDPQGNVLWNTATPGGIPISPTFTDNGAIMLATMAGPVSAYDVQTGALIGQLALTETLLIGGQPRPGIFDTANTPAVYGNRIYISTVFRAFGTAGVQPYGRLYALDVNRPDGRQAEISIAWYFEFRGPSGASPLLLRSGGQSVIYFDGSGVIPGGPTDPQFFAVKDLGAAPQLLWQYSMPTMPVAAAAADPRGGLWVYAPLYPQLLRLSPAGQLIQVIDLDTLVGEAGVHVPYSALTIAGLAPWPVMILSARAVDYSSVFVTAIDLANHSLLWKYRIDESLGRKGSPLGQFPILKTATGAPVVILSTAGNGVWGLSSPAATPIRAARALSSRRPTLTR